MERIRRHVTFANVASLMALVFAMGGTGYAISSLPKDSVGTRQLKKDAVVSSKVKNGSLKALDFKAGQLPAGPQGLQGPKGDQGAPGTDGRPGADGHPGTFGSVTTQFAQAASDLGNGAEVSVDVHCPAGQVALGGGTRGDLTNSELTKTTSSRPIISTGNSGAPDADGTFTGWRGTFVNENNGAGIRPEVWVICATPAGR
jgi:hypothetical protein